LELIVRDSSYIFKGNAYDHYSTLSTASIFVVVWLCRAGLLDPFAPKRPQRADSTTSNYLRSSQRRNEHSRESCPYNCGDPNCQGSCGTAGGGYIYCTLEVVLMRKANLFAVVEDKIRSTNREIRPIYRNSKTVHRARRGL
jgi:hypothetical protein